jgi:imidazolonepropionase-like amidohydrolase/Tol biopolymer transport system component
MKRKISLFLISFVFLYGTIEAQKSKKPEWNVSEPPGPFKTIEFNTDEGTWMNLDVSPDGKEIVFDLLGDIYSMPAKGGEAKLLAGGNAFDVQPRFSPDGKKISYTSDKGGGDNIWMMNKDGSSKKQITKEDFRLLNNAVWTADGNYLIARKHFTSSRSLGAGELWMYHFSGGEGIQLTKRKNDQQDLGEPCISPDGKYVYYSEDVYPGGRFEYNKDPNSQIYVIKRYEFAKNETEVIVGGPGGAFRPQVSRDGKLLAFVRRVRTETVLFLHDLETGEEWPVNNKLSKDQQEAWAIFGVYPNFTWMPDNKHILIWSGGKIMNVDIESSEASVIPFSVKSTQHVTEAVKYIQEVSPEKFTSKAIRQAVTSPDEKMLVFNAAGYLWKKELPNGIPQRLTSGTDFEFEPSFSKAGDRIAYVSWNDEETGAIMELQMKPGSAPKKLSPEKGMYRNPHYSSDGNRIVYRKEEGNEHLGFNHCVKPGLYYMNTSGDSKPELICKEGTDPVFSADDKGIFYILEGESEKKFKWIGLNGKDEKTIFTSKYSTGFYPSPDNQWIVFNELFNAYIAPFPPSGKTVDLSASGKSVPVSRLTKDAGINIHWSSDSKKIHWTIGDEYFTNFIKDRFTFLEGSPDTLRAPDSTGIKINLILKTDKPSGMLALKGARIITMNGNQVIEKGTIIIHENKISEIGNESEISIPADAKVIDVSGKTITPGFVDVHSHLFTFRYGMSPQKQWSYFANLAYGVTTTHDPSSNSEMVFSQSEMVKAGYMTGPRIYSTGTILYGAEGDFKAVVNSFSDALSAIRRTKAYGAFSVKSYNQPRRDQSQQIIEAARKLGVMVYPEGGSFFFHNMAMILDGHTGIEHSIPVAPLYKDVVKLWAGSRTGYTPTLIVSYGSVFGENYWYQKTNVWENKKLLNFYPRSIIDSRSRHRTMIPEEEWENGFMLVSRSCKKLSDSGVKVNLGSHGQLQGLGAHWELWMLAMGGMSSMEVLRAATMNGAEYIGMSKEIGSLEKGKLADLIVMDKNPLDDIRNTESIKYTMLNGRLYDAFNMDEIGNHPKKRSKFYWEKNRYNASFPWHEKTNSFIQAEED